MNTITQVWRPDGTLQTSSTADSAEPWVMPPADFMTLFTDSEQDAIEESTHPIGKAARRTLFTVREVRQNDPLLGQLLGGLVSIGILTQQRKDRVLLGLPPE